MILVLFIVAVLPNIPPNAGWIEDGITIAGSQGSDKSLKQLDSPHGLYVDENQTVYIADSGNHRIVEWKSGGKIGQVVAGGNGQGCRTDQLNKPTDVIADKATNSLIICDRWNRRVMRWSCRNGTKSGETIIENISCWGLVMDDQRLLYVSDWKKNEVRRFRMGETEGIVVAGGNEQGDRLNQLSFPTYLSVDREQSVYVSDSHNNRVMKWMKDATEGIVVAGDRGESHDLTQMNGPQGLFVDSMGTVYVADRRNHRVLRWCKGVTQGDIIIGGNEGGEKANQLYMPEDLSFDRHGNLYVVDWGNNRAQKYSIQETK
jgi:sugar lactone lactonase YvrE